VAAMNTIVRELENGVICVLLREEKRENKIL